MAVIYVTPKGACLGRRRSRFLVRLGDRVLVDIPAIHVDQVILLRWATLTPAALELAIDHQIPVFYLGLNGQVKAYIQPWQNRNVPLRLRQYAWATDPERACQMARLIVAGKIHNMRVVLQRFCRFQGGPSEQIPVILKTMTAYQRQVIQAADLDSIRGIEGQATQSYFQALRDLIRVPEVRFEKRTRRPPTDPFNAALSFGYTLLAKDCLAAGLVAGMDPYVGFLHGEKYGRPALALDLMEEFRPIVTDRLVLRCFNRRELQTEHFESHPGGAILLNESGRRIFIDAYEQLMRTVIVHPILRKKVTYRRCIELQGRCLAKALMGEVPTYRPFTFR